MAKDIKNGIEKTVNPARFEVLCNNPVVMMGQFQGDLKPDYVIPFKLTKEHAKRVYLAVVQRAKTPWHLSSITSTKWMQSIR